MATSGIKDAVYKIWVAPWKDLAEETEVLEKSKEYFVQPWVEIAGAASSSLQRSKPDPKDLSAADFDVELDSEGGAEEATRAEPPRASSRAELAVIFDTLDVQQRRADEAKAQERLERDTWRQRAQSQRMSRVSYRSAPSLDQSHAEHDRDLALDQPSPHNQDRDGFSECLEIFSLLIATARGGEASRNVTDQARTKLTNLGARARVLVAGLVLLTAVVVYVMGARLGWGVDTQLSGLRMHFAASVLGINATENMDNSTKAETRLPVNGTRQRRHDPHAGGGLGGGARKKRHTGVGPADLDPHADELEQENEEAEWRDHPANRLGKPDAVDLEEFDDEPLPPETQDTKDTPSKDQDTGQAHQEHLEGENEDNPAPAKQDAGNKDEDKSDHSNQDERHDSGNTNVTVTES